MDIKANTQNRIDEKNFLVAKKKRRVLGASTGSFSIDFPRSFRLCDFVFFEVEVTMYLSCSYASDMSNARHKARRPFAVALNAVSPSQRLNQESRLRETRKGSCLNKIVCSPSCSTRYLHFAATSCIYCFVVPGLNLSSRSTSEN